MCWAALLLGLAAGIFAGLRLGKLSCELAHNPGPGPGREGR